MGTPPCGDHGVGAQRNRQVRDDAQGVVDVDSLKDLLRCSTVTQLFGSPVVERRAVRAPCAFDSPNVGWCTAGQHPRAGAQSGGDGRGEVAPLVGTRTKVLSLLVERPLQKVDDLRDLSDQFHERAVVTGRTSGPHGRVDVFTADGRDRAAGNLRERRRCIVSGMVSLAGHQGCHGDARFGGPLAQGHAFEPRPQEQAGEG